jgi:hypothetical protein
VSLKPYFNNLLLVLPIKKIKQQFVTTGLTYSIFHIYKDLVNPHYVFANDKSVREYGDFDFSQSLSWKAIIRHLFFILCDRIGLPLEWMYPAILLVGKRNPTESSSRYSPDWIKASLHVTSSIGQYQGKSHFFRHSIGFDFGEKERNLLLKLSGLPGLREHIILPSEKIDLAGIPTFNYEYVRGHDLTIKE